VSRCHGLIVLLHGWPVSYGRLLASWVLLSWWLGSEVRLSLCLRLEVLPLVADVSRSASLLAAVSLVDDGAEHCVFPWNELLRELPDSGQLLLPLLFRHNPDCLSVQFVVLLLDNRHPVDLRDRL
jgi:hypothetical protein